MIIEKTFDEFEIIRIAGMYKIRDTKKHETHGIYRDLHEAMDECIHLKRIELGFEKKGE